MPSIQRNGAVGKQLLHSVAQANGLRCSGIALLIDPLGGGRLRLQQKVHVHREIGRPEGGQAMLPVAEEVAGPAQLQILLGDAEAV